MINSVTLTCNKHNRVTDFTVEPMTDDKREKAIEKKWIKEQGIDPETGKAWLTPRMIREASYLVEAWNSAPRAAYD